MNVGETSIEISQKGMTTAEKGAYLKLDQTTPQTVDNGAPHFDGGLIIKSGQKLIMDGS